MKNFHYFCFFVFLTCNIAFAQEPTKSGTEPTQKTEPAQIAVSTNEDRIPEKEVVVEKRGCCSHHGGVCGCQGGRAKCCDGTLSPSCGCD
jgi:hypothetical protein